MELALFNLNRISLARIPIQRLLILANSFLGCYILRNEVLLLHRPRMLAAGHRIQAPPRTIQVLHILPLLLILLLYLHLRLLMPHLVLSGLCGHNVHLLPLFIDFFLNHFLGLFNLLLLQFHLLISQSPLQNLLLIHFRERRISGLGAQGGGLQTVGLVLYRDK